MVFRTYRGAICFYLMMLRLFCSSTKKIKKNLSNEFQFWWNGNFLSINLVHRPNLVYSPAYAVNQFNTCQWFLRDNLENIENFNPSKMIIKKDGTIKKKKKHVGVRVYLLNEKGISSSLYLQDAEKLAKRQGLELKKVEDINGVPAYKLVQFSDLLESEIPSMMVEKKKEDKIKKLIINADINSHDLQIKINHISKFLTKGIKVFVKLGDKNSNSSKLNAIYSELEKSLSCHSVNKFVSKSGFHINIGPKEINTNCDKKR